MTQPSQYLQDLPPEQLQRIAASVVEKMRAQRKAREDFAASPRFREMLLALRDSPLPQGFTEEDLAYARESTLRQLGWESATDEELKHFVDVVADPDGTGVERLTSDPDCPFENCSFTHFGLHVRMLFGQGTAVYVCNELALRSKD